MAELLSSLAQERLEELITLTTSQIPSLCFSQHLSPTNVAMPDMGVSSLVHQEET